MGTHGSKDSSDGKSMITQKLSELSTQLVQATSDRISKEAMYREVEKGDAESISTVLNNPLIQAMKKDYATAEAEYSQLSRVYKPDYPRMVRLREQINQIKTRISAETAKTVSGIKRDYEAAVKRENYLKSTLSEAYRAIGTYIQFSSAVKPPKSMLITSARKGEGKTTTAVNTAITMAHSYGKGLIIDADMRNPQLHKIFDVDPLNGLSSFLTGNIEFGDGLIKRTKVENLDIIPAGIIPPNPSELLSSYRMRDLINGLFTLYSFVVIDSPPLLGLSDSIILSTLTDGVIVVVRSGNTPRDLVVQTKKLLYGVNAKILGVVLNGIKESDLRYGSYSYYSSYYYDESTDGKGRKKKKRRHGDNA